MTRPLPEGLHGRPFSVREALQLGATEKQLRRPVLTAPYWGVRTEPGDTFADRVRAFATRMQDGAFYSHGTAARLHGIPLPWSFGDDDRLHVSVPTERRGPVGRGAVGHHLMIHRDDLVTVEGFVTTSLARTVFDLAADLHDEDLLAALDNVLWWRRPSGARETPESLSDALLRFRGRRGRGRLLELLPLACDRSDAPPESAFRLKFIRAGFPPPIPNRRIYDARGRFLAMPDLQFAEYRMAYDYEGDHHRTDRAQWHKDLARVPRLQDAGWHHTRLSAADLADDRQSLDRAHRLLLQRGWRP